ncbi:hypothetical protein JVU11DRAFT_217 [Chiua virens]|nr:hypothetical protein JVU11DRAFT_217 [Chiua virens]
MSSHFTPTPPELALVNQIFAQVDTQKVGILTGDVAVRVFGGAKLSPSALGEIWNIADEDNNGFLTRKGVAVAVRLIGWAQKGEKISQALLNKSGPLATIDGFHVPLVPQGTGMSIPKSPPPGLPLLTPQDKAKFAKLFQGCRPVNGLLNGEKARDVFVKSRLPVDKLTQIWSLADTQDRGMLDLTDFTIAMYLIQATMSNQLSFIPTTLPPGLYEQAAVTAVAAHATGASARPVSPAISPSFSVPVKQSPVQANFSGQQNISHTLSSQRVPVAQSPTAPFPGGAPAAAHWDVTPIEKAGADRFFDNLDQHKRGYIEGDVAVPFMLQSNLPEEVLAQVWDLADINNDGRLTRDGFAVAMQGDSGDTSSSLVPPSMRSNGPASPFAAASHPPASEPIRDLLWDDSPPTSTVNTQLHHNALQPQATGIPPSTISPPPFTSAIQEDPFASRSPFNKDLLGDDDDSHPLPSLHDQSAEIGNLQNQVNSTSLSLHDARAERETLETNLANQAAQLSALQTQLASAKASFETETTLLNTLKERHASQNAEIQKVREELIRNESDLSAIRVEKAEIEGAFLRDKEEVRDLNRRMAVVTSQTTTTKQEVEKAKRDAKQQKGLLAIARKQLATKESEKAKADQELEEAQNDLASTVKEREEAEVQADKSVVLPQPIPAPERVKSPADSLAFAAAHPLPVTPDFTGSGPLSPGSTKSNNPFERLAMSSETATPRSQSPFMNFSTASLPPPPGLLPPDAAATTLDNPFGISQVFDSEPQPLTEVAPDNDVGVSTPKVKAIHEYFGKIVSSPTDDELFSTPPNGATPVQHDGDATPHVPSLDSAAAHFPALEDLPSGDGKDQTDLLTDLHDLDVDESDSDEESDEGHPDGTSQDQESRPPEVSSMLQDNPRRKDEFAPSSAPTSFDDIFGASSDTSMVIAPSGPEAPPKIDNVSATQNGSVTLDAFGMPLKPTATSEEGHDSGFTFINTPVNVTSKSSGGSSSFDEAFGKSSTGGAGQTASSFSFDSAFEDNFDFGTSSGTGPELPPKTSSDVPLANGSTSTKQTVTATANSARDIFVAPPPIATPSQVPASFGDGFSSDPWTVQTTAPQAEKTMANQSTLSDISFEEAFGGVDTSQALKLDNAFSTRPSNVITNATSAPHSDAAKPFPAMSPPTSPRGPTSPRVTSSLQPGSPHRTVSPPPRVASPKTQRNSTSSSSARDVAHEKPPPPPRHSKLSLLLPFGKRKKHDAVPPVPAPHSGQHHARVEEPGKNTPGVDDDVEPVRHLASMGFSRTQAVAALEAHDYDFQKALNNLLGA